MRRRWALSSVSLRSSGRCITDTGKPRQQRGEPAHGRSEPQEALSVQKEAIAGPRGCLGNPEGKVLTPVPWVELRLPKGALKPWAPGARNATYARYSGSRCHLCWAGGGWSRVAVSVRDGGDRHADVTRTEAGRGAPEPRREHSPPCAPRFQTGAARLWGDTLRQATRSW